MLYYCTPIVRKSQPDSVLSSKINKNMYTNQKLPQRTKWNDLLNQIMLQVEYKFINRINTQSGTSHETIPKQNLYPYFVIANTITIPKTKIATPVQLVKNNVEII